MISVYGKVVKKMLLDREITVTALAKRLNVSRSHMGRVLSGRVPLTAQMRSAIRLNLSPDDAESEALNAAYQNQVGQRFTMFSESATSANGFMESLQRNHHKLSPATYSAMLMAMYSDSSFK